ncbi:DUF1592 domain-containing protein [Planctomycetes bacterium K23_9]|uniref:Planctomycete cytochrome C n=1 Tax=Stieleria marina TaxID=1930275 RepID=A0A517NQ20_9BACT|nr:hypothetical protein K239x_11710 [Planctomycetes bacterium K23_9]
MQLIRIAPACFIPFVAFLFLAIGTLTCQAEDSRYEAAFQQQLLPLLRTYCLDCHDSGSEISLEEDSSAAAVLKNRKLWVSALNHVRAGSMPPEDGERMDAATRKRMEQLIDGLANAVNCVQNPNAGKVALRRLNRHEYRNTIRDLTGVDYEPATGFPGDDVGYGFDNIGDVLSLPPILFEKYLDAAEYITGQAIYTPPPAEIYETSFAASSLIGAENYVGNGRLTMASNGTVGMEVQVPFGGRFKLILAAAGDQGGDEPVKVEIRTGSTKKVLEIPSSTEEEYTVEFRLGRGKRKIEISFLNDFYVKNKIDRNFHLYNVYLTGEQRKLLQPSDNDLPTSHRKLIFVKPNQKTSVESATAQVIGRLASRAFRRPATNDEVNRLSGLAAKVRGDGGTYEESIQVALQAILVSPHFIFRVEQPRSPTQGGPMPPVSEYELATRISYFLWSSMPDDELLLMAHRGQLRDPKLLLKKVGRMINDRRSNRFVESFASQWLQLRNLDIVDPDTRIYRTFDDDIRKLMRRETLTFFLGVMRDNRPVTDLLDANFTYLNEPLAKYYGIRGVSGEQFRRVSLEGTQRGGLLTHASVLTVTSNPTRTSPVKRGKWILDNLLNLPPPPAPADVPELEKSKLVGTLRERMEQHRESPACAACHNVMDPLGFALENFDAVGLWRDRDGKDAVDARGELPDGTQFDGAADLRRVLSTTRREQFVRCIAEKMLIYSLGRGTEYYDKCAIDRIVAGIKRYDYKFAYLIAAIIQSDPFQKQGFRE